MNDTPSPLPKPEVIKHLRIAIGLHLRHLPQLKGRGAPQDRRQIDRAVDRFAEQVAETFLKAKIVMQGPCEPIRTTERRGVAGTKALPGEVIYKMSAMIAVRYENGFAVVELLQDVDLIDVGASVVGAWTIPGLATLTHRGRILDAIYHGVWPDRSDAERHARG